MINRVCLLGHVSSNPETHHLAGDQAVCNFSVETDSKGKDGQKHTEWHRIVVWGKLAETAQKVLKTGSLISLEGRIQSRDYKDKAGQKRTSFEIVANSFCVEDKAA